MNRAKAFAILAIAVPLCVSSASAGVLNGYGGALISGSTPFQGFYDYTPGPNLNPSDLNGYIDWAVFSPGTFPAAFTASRYVAGSWVSFTPGAGDYVYTYQGF